MSNTKENVFNEAPIKVVGENSTQLNEFKLSWAGKLFFAGVAAYVLGKTIDKLNIPIKVRGKPEEIQVIVDAIMSSKRFQQELSKPGATINSVIEKMEIRNLSKENFKSRLGIDWPL